MTTLAAFLLTLLVIPVVYDLLDRRGDAWYVERRKRAERGEALVQGEAS